MQVQVMAMATLNNTAIFSPVPGNEDAWLVAACVALFLLGGLVLAYDFWTTWAARGRARIVWRPVTTPASALVGGATIAKSPKRNDLATLAKLVAGQTAIMMRMRRSHDLARLKVDGTELALDRIVRDLAGALPGSFDRRRAVPTNVAHTAADRRKVQLAA
jgi:hypothetical protein